MSRPKETSPPEGTWTETIHGAITSTSGAVYRVVNAVTGYPNEAGAEGPSTKNIIDYSATATSGATSSEPITTTKSDSTTTSSFSPTSTSTQKTTTGTTPTSSSTDTTMSTSSPPQPAAPQQDHSGSPTLTDKPSHTSTTRSDPSPSGPAIGGPDSSQTESKDPSSSLPPPQTSSQNSSTTRGDAPDKTDGSASENRQVNKGDSVGNTSDPNSRLKAAQESGPVSMSGQETSHPGAGSTPAAGASAPVGDPSSGQAPKDDKEGGTNPLNEPSPKSKEDAEDPGTGQKYVKTSGVAAKGGDFDASKPGAGVNILGYGLLTSRLKLRDCCIWKERDLLLRTNRLLKLHNRRKTLSRVVENQVESVQKSRALSTRSNSDASEIVCRYCLARFS